MEDAAQLQASVASMREARDDELAVAACSDIEAFGFLYERHRLAVFRYLRTRTISDTDAAELTAQTFDRALAAIARFRPKGGGFLAWLLRIARNVAIDAHRRRRTGPDRLVIDVVDHRSSGDPEAAVLAKERLAALSVAFDRLTDRQREALSLRYAAGLTAREIGEVLGKREDAAQKLLSRALAALREDDIDGR